MAERESVLNEKQHPPSSTARSNPEDQPQDWLSPLLARHAPMQPVPCVPELVAPRCHQLRDVWEAAEEAMGSSLEHAPFWATPWPGGIAVARWIIDHPEPFAGARVLDLGCGSGVSGLAVARVGGSPDLNDVDPLAISVARLTAQANRLAVNFVLGTVSRMQMEAYDVILVGDGFYERPRAAHLLRTLGECVDKGCTVLAADAGRRVAELPGIPVLEVEVPVCQDVEGRDTRLASVHLLEP